MPTARADMFTPIHKGYRAMMYDLGSRLQSNDFGDLEATRSLVADLEHEFGGSVSAGCALCIIHSHAAHEESVVFPAIADRSADLVKTFIEDHHAFTVRLDQITRKGRGILDLPQAEDRARVGAELNAEFNEFFAAYFDHMNREEAQLVPWMREQFTDAEMGAMTLAIMRSIPPERIAIMLRWILPALNVDELTGMLAGVKQAAPPPLLALVAEVGRSELGSKRWSQVSARVGL